jgi:hypothetical protein
VIITESLYHLQISAHTWKCRGAQTNTRQEGTGRKEETKIWDLISASLLTTITHRPQPQHKLTFLLLGRTNYHYTPSTWRQAKLQADIHHLVIGNFKSSYHRSQNRNFLQNPWLFSILPSQPFPCKPSTTPLPKKTGKIYSVQTLWFNNWRGPFIPADCIEYGNWKSKYLSIRESVKILNEIFLKNKRYFLLR